MTERYKKYRRKKESWMDLLIIDKKRSSGKQTG